jgi:hypothetical protein
MNIVDLIKNELGPQLAGAAEQIPGVGPEKAQTALQAAIPALLASFARLGATSSGANALNAAVGRAVHPEPEVAGAAAGGTAETGSHLLSSLLGEGGLRTIVTAVASFAGLNTGSASSLLGLAGSLVLGFLGRQAGTAGGEGIAGLLAGQKGNIEAALPPGLSSLLGSSGSLPHDATQATAKAGPARKAPRPTWLKPVAIVAATLVAALVVWELTSGPSEPETDGSVAPPAIGSVANVDLGSEASADIGRLTQVFRSVTDLSSANAAVPQVATVGNSVDRLRALAGQLPASGRSSLADLVAQALPAVQSAADRAYVIPGAAEVLKPVADPVLASLAELAKT